MLKGQALINHYNQEYIAKIKENKQLASFAPGDTIQVHLQNMNTKTKRLQIFEGIVLKIKGSNISKTFTVRKIAAKVGVEKTFPFYAFYIKKITIVKKAHVRRAKLFYLRSLSTKALKLKEKK